MARRALLVLVFLVVGCARDEVPAPRATVTAMRPPASLGTCPEVPRAGLSALLHDGAEAFGVTPATRHRVAAALPRVVQELIW